jgi:glycosyltransferase involved in cell wall biosynthesis
MKIGVDIRVLMDKEYSGISQYTASLLEEILKQDQNNQYYLFYNSFFNIANKMNIWQRDNASLINTSWPNKIFNYGLQKTLKYPKLDQLGQSLDIFWSPHFNFTALSTGVKFILTIHDLSFVRYPEFFSYRKNFWHRSINIDKQINRANALVAVSQHTLSDLKDLYQLSDRKSRYIYSGVNEIVINPNTEDEKKYLKKNNLKKDFIFYLGNIEPRKNLAGLIFAYNLLRDNNINLVDTQLVIAGPSGWKNREVYQAQENSPYHQNIKFLAYVSEKEKEILFKNARLLCYPSYYEGFGFPPLEAMKRGVPVITSNISSLPEVVQKAALSINPYDINEMARAMEMLIFEEDLREDLINKGYEQVKKFNWQKTAKEYLDLFQNL